MKQLTKAEEEIMQILWQLEKATVKTIIENFKGSKPAYNTVSTIVRIMENKGFVGYEKVGKGHLYFPLLAQSEYSNQSISKLVNGYFQGSFKSMVSFFMEKNDINTSELTDILKEIEKNNKKS